MIKKNPSDGLDAIIAMIDDLHELIVEQDEQDISVITARIEEATAKLNRPRVIDGGKVD